MAEWNSPGWTHADTIRHRNTYACVRVDARAPRSFRPAQPAAVTENAPSAPKDCGWVIGAVYGARMGEIFPDSARL